MTIEAIDWILRVTVAIYCIVLFLHFVRTKKIPQPVIVWGIFGYIILQISALFAKAYVLNRLYESSDGIWQYYSLAHSDLLYESFANSMERFGVSALLALVVFIVFYTIVTVSKSGIVDMEDALLLTFGAFATGWPNFILFVGVVFIVTILIKVIRVLFKKENLQDRIIITPAIPLAFIVMVFFGSYLAQWTNLNLLR